MIDFHTHILPRFDDGAANGEESVLMLSRLKALGFNRVVLSSHYYSNACSAEDFLAKRSKAFELLCSFAEGAELPELFLGAEVYITPLLLNNESLNPLTVNGKGAMLAELPYDKRLSTVTADTLEKLVYNYSITPVLAHIERYPFLLDSGLLAELYSMGCYGQVNLSSFCGRHARKLKKLAKKGFLFALGSDAHCAEDCNGIRAYIDAAEKSVGADYIKASFAYTKEKLI